MGARLGTAVCLLCARVKAGCSDLQEVGACHRRGHQAGGEEGDHRGHVTEGVTVLRLCRRVGGWLLMLGYFSISPSPEPPPLAWMPVWAV